MTSVSGSDHTPREVENGFRQFDLCVAMVEFYLNPERPFSLRVSHILDLQKEAVEGIEADAGRIRTGTVGNYPQ